MGFLQVVNGSEMDAEKLAQIWGKPRSERIENGSKVIVRSNEVLIYIKNRKAADVLLHAGGYIYHSDLESDTDMKSYADVFDEISEKHSDFFDGKETVILPISGGANSPARFGEALAELAKKDIREARIAVLEALQGLAEEKNIRETPPQNGKWICSRCGTENEHRFCKKCGSPSPVMPSKSREIWICSRCGTENEHRFCKKCGSPSPVMPSKSREIWICSRCGTENEHRFCKKCGNSHESDSKIDAEPKPPYDPVPKTQENLWICGRCGTKNNFRFCKNCGSPQPNYH